MLTHFGKMEVENFQTMQYDPPPPQLSMKEYCNAYSSKHFPSIMLKQSSYYRKLIKIHRKTFSIMSWVFWDSDESNFCCFAGGSPSFDFLFATVSIFTFSLK